MVSKREVVDSLLKLGPVVFVFDGTGLKSFDTVTNCMIGTSEAKDFESTFFGVILNKALISWDKIYCVIPADACAITWPNDVPNGHRFNVNALGAVIDSGRYTITQVNADNKGEN